MLGFGQTDRWTDRQTPEKQYTPISQCKGIKIAMIYIVLILRVFSKTLLNPFPNDKF